MKVKICIVGCGAIGSIFGAYLARLEMLRCTHTTFRKEQTRAITERGLRISGAADFTRGFMRLPTAGDPLGFRNCGPRRATHTRAAIEQTAHIFGADSAVCSVKTASAMRSSRAARSCVIRGTTFPAGHAIEPGHVGFDINGDTWIGPFEPTHTPYARGEQLAELLNRAGLRVIPFRTPAGAQWTKLISTLRRIRWPARLTLLHHGAATRFAPTGALFNALIAEGEAFAKALGIELHGDPRALVQKGGETAPGKHKASMLQDILARRQTEVDFMNGAIADWGERPACLLLSSCLCAAREVSNILDGYPS